MKILIDNGCYHLRNMGDVVMLQVAVSRLRDLWPEAKIDVFTNEPELLSLYCPGTNPISAQSQDFWFRNRNLFGRFSQSSSVFKKIDRAIAYRWPLLAWTIIGLRTSRRQSHVRHVKRFLKAFLASDLIVASGDGGINDIFQFSAESRLELFYMASLNRKSSAMFGQGIGPIENPILRNLGTTILPLVDIICIREKRAGIPLLDSLKIPRNRVVVTGDEAIEIAYNSKPNELGNSLGINLRVAEYSEVNSHHLQTIGEIVRNAASKYNAPLVAVPILLHKVESDLNSIHRLVEGHDGTFVDGEHINSPIDVIKQIGQCRVVVTGSYHGAVLALSQGIPSIGLAKSRYYSDKFLGLSDQFSVGCEVLFMDDKDLGNKLKKAIDKAWKSAEILKTPLLKAAHGQIKSAHSAYQRLYELVELRKTKPTISRL